MASPTSGPTHRARFMFALPVTADEEDESSEGVSPPGQPVHR